MPFGQIKGINMKNPMDVDEEDDQARMNSSTRIPTLNFLNLKNRKR